MPGLSGLISDSALRDPAASLERMESVQRLPGVRFLTQPFSDRYCAILNVATGLLPESEHGPARSDDLVLFLEGEVFDIAGVALTDKDSVHATLLRRYRERGPSFVEALNGEFNILIYEPRDGRLSLFSDHLSSRPMFYAHREDRFIFGLREEKSVGRAAGFSCRR